LACPEAKLFYKHFPTNGFYSFPAGKPKVYPSPQFKAAQAVVIIIQQAFDVDSGVVRLGCP